MAASNPAAPNVEQRAHAAAAHAGDSAGARSAMAASAPAGAVPETRRAAIPSQAAPRA